MIGIHEKLKYGDIVYIEFFNQFKKSRIVLTSSGFVLRHKSYVETKKIVLQGDSIYLKDFEDNLFVIFPTMNEEYLTHKTILDEKIKQIKPKVELSQNIIEDASTKKDINKLITTFQEAKKDVYGENEKFLKQIGTPIKFGDNFILIHFKSQMFVTKHDFDSLSNQNKNKLILSDYYTDDCIFLFSPFNNYDGKADYVFSNQNLFIRKKEKNMWANNQYMKIKVITEEETKGTVNNNMRNSSESGTQLGQQKNEKYLLSFTEDQNNASAFQVKVCSNYIDPSSSNLSFANPIWICCQNVDKYLIITPNKKDEGLINDNTATLQPGDDNPRNTRKSTGSLGGNKLFRNSTLTNYTISFAPIDREKTMNNIYGLFNIEQIENQKNISYNDQYLKEQLMNNIELRVSPKIEYNKKIRFRHVATKKYLGFEEKVVEALGRTKSTGSLILEDIPNEKCDWTFMESYKIIDREKYQKSKEEGIKAPSKEIYSPNPQSKSLTDNQSQTVKKKEILRVFHLKSQKFLSFDELTSKIVSEFDERNITVRNLSLNKNPNDSDLVRLLPSNENQSWEIHLVLYFNSVLCKQISNLIKTDIHKYIYGDPSNNLIKLEPIPEDENNTDTNIISNTSPNNQPIPTNPNVIQTNPNIVKTKYDFAMEKETYDKELRAIKNNSTELRICFENLRDFCLNKFERKFDTITSPGKPVHYRQEFLYDQGFLDKTFIFLSNATKFSEVYAQYIKIAEQNIGGGKSKETSTPSPIITTTPINTGTPIHRKNSNLKKRKKANNSNLASLGDIFKEIIACIQCSFEFLSAMCKNHLKNKEYVFKHREVFYDYLLQYKQASECLINIIQDDENYMNEIIQEAIDNKDEEESKKNIIGTIINYLNSNEKYDTHTLNLLSKMMKSKDKGITSSQEYIYNSLFEIKKDKFLLKITPQYNDTVFHVVYRNENKEFVSRNLIELCLMKNNLSDYEKNIVRYLAEELNLYADLCYGRNYVCIEKVRSLFPLDHLIYHISNIELHEEILSGLINILNYVYIDIEPHAETIYPSMIKIVTDELKIEKLNKISIKTYIPLDKLYLILCLSLYLLHNIKFGKILVNTANINLIYNIIKFRLYENVEYKTENIKEVINTQLDRSIHNLKEEVKNFIINGEKIIQAQFSHQIIGDKANKKEKGDEKGKKQKQTFFDKIGYKFVEFDFDHEIGNEYLIFVLDHINEFFLERVIIDNIDANMENKNIIAQTFKTVNKTDMLTQNNINYLIKVLIELKFILTSGNGKKIFSSNNDLTDKQKVFLPIIKQIANVIDFILNIKKEDMINQILENLMKENKNVISIVLNRLKLIEREKEKQIEEKKKNEGEKENDEESSIDVMRKEKIYEKCEEEFSKNVNFKETMMENEYYLYQLFNHLKPEENSNESNIIIHNNQKNKNDFKQNLSNKNNNNEINENYSLLHENHVMGYKEKLFILNYENEYLNSIAFKTLQELIIKILEVNIDERMTKILVKLFTRIHTQRKEIIECIKNMRMLYGEKDLRKYIQCRTLIKKLGILTEKTEIWMSVDKLPIDKLVTKDTNGFKATFDVAFNNTNEVLNDNEENFENVIKDLNMLIRMCYRKNTQNMYKRYEKLRLMQTIFFSFKLHDVLFSLIREITQVFPIAVKEDDYKERYFKKSLEILLRQIFKLFRCMVHNSIDFQENIKETINFCKSYEYLNELGFLELITDIVIKNENFVNENIKFIMDLLIKHFKLKTFSNIFKFFNVDDLGDNNKNEIANNVILEEENDNEIIKISKRQYEKEIKQCCQILELVKAVLYKVKETKYLNLIINNFEDIMKHFTLFTNINKNLQNKKLFESKLINEKEIYQESPTMQIIKITSKTSNYKMKMLHYLTKIGYRLMRINEKLKGLILKIFPLYNLQENILKIDLPLNSDNVQKLLDMTIKSEREKLKRDHCIESQLKSFYKLKYNGFILFSMIANDLQRTKDLKKNMEVFFDILEKDCDKYTELEKILKGYYDDTDEHKSYVMKMMKKNAYRYFFKGIFCIIFQLTSVFKRDIFKSESEYQNAIKNFKKVMKKWKLIFLQMLKDKKNYEFYSKILSYVQFKKQNFIDYFDKFRLPTLININYNLPKVDKYYRLFRELKKEKPKNKNEITLLIKNRKIIKKQLIIGFTEDFISRIENYKKVTNYIQKEVKILSKNLKSKINFHQAMQMYINENNANSIVDEILFEQENNYHLLNVFLKFVQENYLSMKYYPQIIFLIELFAYFIEVKPMFLRSQNKEENVLKSNFYFLSKISELNDNFLVHCQKIFLNNGSVEVFLKIVCEGNKTFNFNVFPSVLHFFNNVLEGGNTLSQAKFYQLFIFFPNSDNLFFYIKQLFDYDIYQNLQNDISQKEPKIDFDNLNTITNLLKFLQLLTENHFSNLQLYLRDQESNRLSYNFIIILVDYMNMLLGKLSNIHETNQVLTKYASELYYKRLIAVLETLCEFLQGPCKLNQETIINSKIIEIFDKILRETEIIDLSLTSEFGNQKKEDNDTNNSKKDNKTFEVEETQEPELENEFNEFDNNSDNLENVNEEKSKLLDKSSFIQVSKLFYLLSDYEKSLLIYKIGLVLLAIIEGRKSKDDVIKKILRDFDYKLIYDKINEMYLKLKDEMEFFLYGEEIEEFDTEGNNKVVAEAGFNLYFFIVMLYTIENDETEFKKMSNLVFKEQHKLSKIEKENLLEISHNFSSIQNAMFFFKENSINIEIVKDNEVLRVFCPKLTFFKNLTQDMLKTFQEEANRTSIQTKLNALLSEKDSLYQTIQQLYKLELVFKKTGPLQFLFTFPKVIQFICLVLTFIMNVFILIGYNVENDKDQKDVLKNVILFGLTEKSKYNINNINFSI